MGFQTTHTVSPFIINTRTRKTNRLLNAKDAAKQSAVEALQAERHVEAESAANTAAAVGARVDMLAEQLERTRFELGEAAAARARQ